MIGKGRPLTGQLPPGPCKSAARSHMLAPPIHATQKAAHWAAAGQRRPRWPRRPRPRRRPRSAAGMPRRYSAAAMGSRKQRRLGRKVPLGRTWKTKVSSQREKTTEHRPPPRRPPGDRASDFTPHALPSMAFQARGGVFIARAPRARFTDARPAAFRLIVPCIRFLDFSNYN